MNNQEKNDYKKKKHAKRLAVYGVGMLLFSFICGLLFSVIIGNLFSDWMLALMLIIPSPIPIFLLWGFFRKTYYNYYKLKELNNGRILPV